MNPSRPALTIAAVLALGLALRLLIGWYFYGTFDVASWQRVAETWPAPSPYDEARRYSYSPLWYVTLGIVSSFGDWAGLPVHLAVKLPQIAADTALFFLLLRLAPGPAAAVFFFLNPVSILNTAYHGQFDCLAYLFVMAACAGSAWFWFPFSALVKHSTLLLTPVFAFRQKGNLLKILFFLAAPSLFLLSLMPYLLSGDAHVVRNVFGDSLDLRLLPGSWGWTLGLRHLLYRIAGIDLQSDARLAFFYQLNYVLYPVLAVLAWRLAMRGRELIDSLLVYLLFFYTFTVQMAPQYTVWILPLAALRRSVHAYVFTALTAAHLVFFYIWEARLADTGDAIILFRLLAWAATAFWLRAELKKAL